MLQVSKLLIQEVETKRPDLYQLILQKIRPHDLDSVLRLFENHLHSIDINIFNEYRENIPEFVWAFIKHLKFPVPGDPFGIYLTCRITKTDTQCRLDSKHLQSLTDENEKRFNVNKSILYELNIFSSQSQVFEQANRHEYATVFLTNCSIDELMKSIPDIGHLERGNPFNMGKNSCGIYKYLKMFRFILVDNKESLKILYKTLYDLNILLRYLKINQIMAFSDIRLIFKKCNITCYFFNLIEIVRRQLWMNDNSVYETDMVTIIKYQCRSGIPLPLTRDGLAKNPDRTPIEILSFEAPKRNYSRLSTCPKRDQWHNVETSSDKIFFGQQFNEGTGYSFAVMPK